MPRFNWCQKLVRLPFRLIPKEAVLPILSGPLRGKRWVFGASNISYWVGSYEAAMTRRMAQDLKPGDTFLDLGAHVGYYTLLAARKVGKTGRVVAAEPLPRNRAYIQRHLRLNKLSERVEVVSAAVSDQAGQASFRLSNPVAARMDEGGELEVEVVALQALLDQHFHEGRLLVKMDIEGQELKALHSIREFLSRHPVRLYLSTHGEERHDACLKLLKELGYSIEALDDTDLNQAREVLAYPAAT